MNGVNPYKMNNVLGGQELRHVADRTNPMSARGLELSHLVYVGHVNVQGGTT
jgi:hypothetical protein